MEHRNPPSFKIAREVLSAGCGAAIADSLFNPMEVIKVKLQLQGQIGQQAPYYKGVVGAARKILAEDGLYLLWTPGLVATWIRGLSYTGFRIGMYPTVKTMFMKEGEDSIIAKFCAGATTGAIGTTLANPVDVVRVRLQGESGVVDPLTGMYKTGLHKGKPQSYQSTFHAFSTIAREEGVIAGLWRGTSANILRGVLLSASQLATYDHTKKTLKERGIMEEGVQLHFTGVV
jgi:hypothetical protein